jgi:hypothetical protein
MLNCDPAFRQKLNLLNGMKIYDMLSAYPEKQAGIEQLLQLFQGVTDTEIARFKGG